MDINTIREDTAYCNKFIHFNNAGASLPTVSVNRAIKSWLDEEEATGGYEMDIK